MIKRLLSRLLAPKPIHKLLPGSKREALRKVLEKGDVEVLGATLSWDLKPTRLFRWPDGFVGIVPGDKQIHPECYDVTGWPIDPTTRLKLEIVESKVRRIEKARPSAS